MTGPKPPGERVPRGPGATSRAAGDAEYARRWFRTDPDPSFAAPEEFRFSYVNYRRERSVRRVPFAGLHFAECPSGSGSGLVLDVPSDGESSARRFAVSLIEPDGGVEANGFRFRYGGCPFVAPATCGLRFGSTEWHPTEQLLLLAEDLDKGAPREFAVADISPP